MLLRYKIWGVVTLAVISLTLAVHLFLDNLSSGNPYHVFQIILAGFMVAGLIYWFLERQLLARLSQLNQQADLITHSNNFALRLPVQGQDELGQLTQTINRMLNTIEETSQQLMFDLEQLQQSDQALKRANRALKTVSASHQAIRHATLEQPFMEEICRILVEVGQYRLAWVGRAEQDEAKTVRPLAHWGDEQHYLETIQLSWDENVANGRGPTGMAIRSQQPQVVRHILTNPDYTPWREAAMARGFASSLALPLTPPELAIYGTLNIYAPEPDAFDFAEIQLLTDVANNLLYGLGLLKLRAEHEQTTQALNEERNFVATILDTVGVLVVVLDVQGRIVRFNRLCEQITGYDLSEVEGCLIWDSPLLRKEDIEPLKTLFHDILAGYFPSKNINYWQRRNSEPCLIDWTNTALLNAEGKVEYVIATGIDLTDQIETENIRHSLEQQLNQAQKMESIGRLAGGVAHDFNNQLTAMIGYTHLAMRRLPKDSPIHQDMTVILQSAERASHLTRQLLTFARRQTIERSVLKLNDLILNVDKMLRRLINEDIELITILDPDAGHIEADAGQFEQILFNLAVNARDAMPHGGKLTLKTTNITLNISEYLNLKPGNYARLSVTDTGIGMTAEVKARIFEPFFTTKPVGKGTGLGLATCFGIVRQHQGHISVESEVGHGTTFMIDWPLATPRSYSTTQSVINPMELPKGNETILLVEDEVAVRQMVVKMLQELGYTLLEAGNGQEALRILQNISHPPIHLVLTDLVMPQMGGRELAEHLSQNPAWANIKVLFMSGYAGEVSLQLSSDSFTQTILQKPFSLSKLALKVRTVLDGD